MLRALLTLSAFLAVDFRRISELLFLRELREAVHERGGRHLRNVERDISQRVDRLRNIAALVVDNVRLHVASEHLVNYRALRMSGQIYASSFDSRLQSLVDHVEHRDQKLVRVLLLVASQVLRIAPDQKKQSLLAAKNLVFGDFW